MKLIGIIATILLMPAWALAQDSVNVEGTGPADLCDSYVRKATAGDTSVYYAVEQQAQFPGGRAAMFMFIRQNMNITECMNSSQVYRKNFIKFLVEKDGRITRLKPLRDSACDEEVMRIIRLMPPWEPGQQNEVIVRSQYVLAIDFIRD